MNLFDSLQRTAFGVVAQTMGGIATWKRSENLGGNQNATILFKDPTDAAKIFDLEYNPKTYCLEYHYPDFPGLFESVLNGNEECIIINDKEYGIMDVISKYDGRTYIVKLELL